MCFYVHITTFRFENIAIVGTGPGLLFVGEVFSLWLPLFSLLLRVWQLYVKVCPYGYTDEWISRCCELIFENMNGLKGVAGKVHKREESSVIQKNLFVPQGK